MARRIRDFLAAPALDALQVVEQGPDAATQIGLTLGYRALIEARRPLPRFDEVGFRCQSQTDEDGILLFLFAVLGVTNKRCVEICAGDGVECNTANLLLNHGWNGLLVDGDERNVERGLRFYGRSRRTYVYPPEFLQAWVTRDSVNDLLRSHGFGGEIDLFSLDMDGVDYWIWEAIEAVTPRVVVLEYQDILGPERSWTVPYADDFRASDYPMTGEQPDFAGASLTAYVKLARRKGYRLVGTNKYGYNAFFVRNGLGDDRLPEIDTHACFGHPKVVRGMRERFPKIERLPWVEV